jgi:hypothetical protein
MNTVQAQASNATSAMIGPKMIKHPTGNKIKDRMTGAMKTLMNVMKFRYSSSTLARGSVDGSLIAPDENKPAVVVILRKKITTKLRAR